MLRAQTIDYWKGLTTPAWESQTQVEYQLVVETSMGVPIVSPSVNWCITVVMPSVGVPILEVECQLLSLVSYEN